MNHRLDQHGGDGSDAGSHDYTYDGLGRVLHDSVYYLDAAKDGAVRRISYTFTPKGQLASAESWNTAAPGVGSKVNEVTFAYTAFGLLSQEFQEHEGPKHGGTCSTPTTRLARPSTPRGCGWRTSAIRMPDWSTTLTAARPTTTTSTD